jgi:hypothetical protein
VLSWSKSSKAVSSEENVMEEERERAGVAVGGGLVVTLARASACDTADR